MAPYPKELLGEPSSSDRFGLPIYWDSKIYHIFNVGRGRDNLLAFLESQGIRILEPNGPFKAVTIVLDDPTKVEVIRLYDSSLHVIRFC